MKPPQPIFVLLRTKGQEVEVMGTFLLRDAAIEGMYALTQGKIAGAEHWTQHRRADDGLLLTRAGHSEKYVIIPTNHYPSPIHEDCLAHPEIAAACPQCRDE